MPKFNVYGRRIAVEKSRGQWQAFDLGNEGKRRLAHDVVVPAFVKEDELAQFLGDLLHESASPKHPRVSRLPD